VGVEVVSALRHVDEVFVVKHGGEVEGAEEAVKDKLTVLLLVTTSLLLVSTFLLLACLLISRFLLLLPLLVLPPSLLLSTLFVLLLPLSFLLRNSISVEWRPVSKEV